MVGDSAGAPYDPYNVRRKAANAVKGLECNGMGTEKGSLILAAVHSLCLHESLSSLQSSSSSC